MIGDLLYVLRSGAMYANMVESYNFLMQSLVNIPRLNEEED